MPDLLPATAVGLLVFAATAVSCATSSLEGGLDSPVPAARLQAIQRVEAEGDASPVTLRRLIEQLDSDDAAVRLLAITTLERLTGENHGYRYDDPIATRRKAIERWIARPEPGPAMTDGAPRAGAGDHG